MDEFQLNIVERLTRIETKIDNGIASKLKDHEERVRYLEKGFWKAVGALAVLQMMGLVAIKVFF